MFHQYRQAGLRLILVAVDNPTRAELINTSYDWHLPIGTLVRPVAPTFGRLGRMTSVPVTLLLDRKHRLVQRWTGLVRPASLAFAIQRSHR
jgi:hypothetical protein